MVLLPTYLDPTTVKEIWLVEINEATTTRRDVQKVN